MLSILVTAVTIFYANTQLRILIDKKDTSVDIIKQTYAPYNVFDLKTGEETPDENFMFHFAFSVYDIANVNFPEDLAKIGKFEVYL